MSSCFCTVCLLKRLYLLHCIAFATLSKISSLYLWGSISGLRILFHWSIVYSFTNTTMSWLPQLLVSLELGSVSPLTLFFFNIELAILDVWCLQIHFRISLPVFWDFDWDCVEFIGQIENIWHLDNIEPSCLWTWNISQYI